MLNNDFKISYIFHKKIFSNKKKKFWKLDMKKLIWENTSLEKFFID